MKKYPIVPGRGLNNKTAREWRLSHLKEQGIELPLIADTHLSEENIRNNIESFIGSVELPLGVAGPLLFRANNQQEWVYTAIGTLEGALVASVNRGAKAISQSGGFAARVLYQRMHRCPMFIFKDLDECNLFVEWIEANTAAIKEMAERYSNHAQLIEINPSIAGRSVHLKFIYTTGNASGQNMTTTCTWHAILWVIDQLKTDINLVPVHYVVEGNGSSDKKIAHCNIRNGRGVAVVAECFLDEEIIRKVLRVDLNHLLLCLQQSRLQCEIDGMIGYNINVANALAGIFVATGQDLGSLHESSIGIFNMEAVSGGLHCTLHLPNLVIGTVGGGTQLPCQQEALQMMGCTGRNSLKRMAQLIAGFALSLEISTISAIVGGQFARVHEKLGRNKPTNWLLKKDINTAFIRSLLSEEYQSQLKEVKLQPHSLAPNGLITALTSRINNKLTGFMPVEILWHNEQKQSMLLKSKPLDSEVHQGLHFMAASIDAKLADLLRDYRSELEYRQTHLKEIDLYQILQEKEIPITPHFFGSCSCSKQEAYMLLIERLKPNQLLLFNTENQPEEWTGKLIKRTIKTIHHVHQAFLQSNTSWPSSVDVFEPWKAQALYQRFASIMATEYKETPFEPILQRLPEYIRLLKKERHQIDLPSTIIHNDFNPRNVCVRSDGSICVYDWELAVINLPTRDIMEFLSFVLPIGFEKTSLLEYIDYHHTLQTTHYSKEDWYTACLYSTKEYLITRLSFYLTGKILMDYPFAERVFAVTSRMIQCLESEKV